MSEVLTHKKPMKHRLDKHIADVLISSPADGQVLTYEAASQKWKNKAPAAGAALKHYHAYTSTLFEAVIWDDDPYIDITIPAPGYACVLYIAYNVNGHCPAAGSLAGIMIKKDGASIQDSRRYYTCPGTDYQVTFVTQWLVLDDGADAIRLQGQLYMLHAQVRNMVVLLWAQ